MHKEEIIESILIDFKEYLYTLDEDILMSINFKGTISPYNIEEGE